MLLSIFFDYTCISKTVRGSDMARNPRLSKSDPSCVEPGTYWEGVRGWAGLPLSVASNSRVRLRRVAWEQLKAPCVVAFVTASQETRMGHVVRITDEGVWLGSEGSDSQYFWERNLIRGLALVLEVKTGAKKRECRQGLHSLPELGWVPPGRSRNRLAAIDRLLRFHESLR